MENRHPREVENYTIASLVMLAVNLTWLLVVIWQTLGFATALLVCVALNHLITRLAQVKARRAAGLR